MDNKNTTPSGKGKKQGNKPGRQMNFYWVYAIVAMFLLTMVMVGDSSTQRQVQWPDFKEMAEKAKSPESATTARAPTFTSQRRSETA